MVRGLLVILMLLLGGPVWAQSAPLAPGEARLTILHDHGRPVVSEMVRLTLRGEYDLTVSLEALEFPGSPDYDWMQISQDRWFQERIGGRMIQIFERDIALFPRRAGTIAVGPVVHALTHVPRAGPRQEVRVRSRPARLDVVPFPHAGPHAERPLAARALILTDELSAQPGQLGPDEVLTRRVTIEALGALSHHLPERPDITQPWLISFTQPELRETRPTPDGPVSRVVWEWQMRPRTGEPGVLPAMGFEWFDTDSRRIEVAAMRPLPFGLAGFGSNLRTGDAAMRGRGVAAAAVLAGFAAALAAILGGRLPAWRAALRGAGSRLVRGPHLTAMRAAAAQGDLPALRTACTRHLDRAGHPGPRRAELLSELDRRIFGPPAPDAFAAEAWLARFLKAR